MEVRQSWFGSSHPDNWKPANTTIGAGADGIVTVNVDAIDETDANGYTIKVVEGVGLNVPMAATLVGKDVEVTLGTDGAGALNPTLNTAELISIKIGGLTGLTSYFSGTGADPIIAAVAKKNFTDMQFGTECPDPFVVVRVDNFGTWDYYTTIAPNGRYDANWRKFNLVDF